MAFLLALTDSNGTIYAMHDKIYFTLKHAQNALKVMVANGKLQPTFKVYEMPTFNLREPR